MPANWTDAGPVDSFVVQSRGRAIARVADLLELVKMTAGDVKGIKPNA
jgi:DNA-binding protein